MDDSTERGAAGHIADSVKGKLGDIAADAARTAVESNLDQAAAAVEARYGSVIDPAAEVSEHVAAFVRARPLTAVLTAAAIGFAIGKTVRPGHHA